MLATQTATFALTPAPGERTSEIGWLLAGYAGLAGFLVVEAVAREGGGASSLRGSTDDEGTTDTIVAAYTLASVSPLLLRRSRRVVLPRAAAVAGLAIQAAGLALRLWSMRTLRSSYSRTLQTQERQCLVESGPYSVVRHPGYLGSVLVWVGFALTSRNLRVVGAVIALVGGAYRRRIAVEERLLRRDLPGYAGDSERTHKLIPFVW